ncbi:hypothetical protein HF086_004169 [Spodoptera exigua]|uniref:Alpha-1,3-mannosyl-glycoprotein 2-beta-N-acetylglucosaminyltransferase n=1 Tax=Spodoptera exigua TaxID=7107 RepID=A0A922M0S7_SPOEX|nr:hypothetical protein HF086_004169 [Spodoptera exigua]
MEVIDMSRPDLLHRTDFFPGLGWVLRKEMWVKLAPKWPAAFFDDWLRNPVNIDGKACIRPEISRTYSFGKDHYDESLASTVYNLPEMSASEVVASSDLSSDPVRVMYSNAKTYQRAAKKLAFYV